MEEKTMRKRFLSLLLVLVCVLTLARTHHAWRG